MHDQPTPEQQLQTSYRQSNVIWVFGDQHRAQAMGHRGDKNVSTPNLDNLARTGMQFTNAVAGAPWCCPFRGSLLTSSYPHQSGVDRTPCALDPNLPTVVQPLREAGYHTAWIGKWHLDGSNSSEHYVPAERRGGFDYWLGYENNNNQEETYVYGTNQPDPVRLDGYETDSLTDCLIEHLTGHVQSSRGSDGDYQPFFAALSVQPPHSPYVPPSHDSSAFYHNPADITLRPNVPQVQWIEEKARLDLAGYYGMIENLDANLGKLRAALKHLGIDRETYIVFFSDHGDCLGSHGQWEKSSPWEESIKIPFIIGTVGGNYHMKTGLSPDMINHVDIAPTTLGLCGISTPPWMQGFDFSDRCIKEGRPEHGQSTAPRGAEPTSAYLQQIPAKFHRHSVNKPWRGILTRDGWKYVCMPDRDWLLFNIHEDPFEMANLCHDTVFQAQKERCHRELQQWIEYTGDEFPLPDIALS